MNLSPRIRWLLVVTVAAAAVAGYLFFERADTAPIVDADGDPVPGSVASLERVEIGGADQWLVIRGHDASNPVLLFLSGGPGASELPRVRRFNEGLERHVTLVVWEQRGCAKSFGAGRDDLSLERYVDDVIELSAYLADRFDREKVYLLGHSWGSIPGLMAAQARPELFHAYLGSAQMIDVLETDRVVYAQLLEHARAEGDARLERRLLELGAPPYTEGSPIMAYKDVLGRAYAEFEAPAVSDPEYRADGDLMKLLLRTREYTLRDKIGFLRGMVSTFDAVYPQLQDLDFRVSATRLELPVYLMLGRNDANATPWLAEAWFEALDAPTKRLWWFEDAGHGLLWERNEHFHRLIAEEILPSASTPAPDARATGVVRR